MDQQNLNASPQPPAPQPSSPQPPEANNSSPVTPPNAQPGKSSSKLPLIIGASALLGLVIFGLIGWLIYSALFSVTKEDYREATLKLNSTVSKASASLRDVTSIAYISSYSTETVTKNNVESAKKSLEEYKKANAELKDFKALRDKDVKKAYDAYMEKYNGYVVFAETYVNSAEKALLAVIECESISSAGVSNVATYKSAITPCEDALDAADSVTDKDLKSFITAYKSNVAEVTKLVEEAAKLSSSDYSRLSAIRSDIYDTTDKLQAAQKDANSNIEKRLKGVTPREAHNDLGDVLTDKQRSS